MMRTALHRRALAALCLGALALPLRAQEPQEAEPSTTPEQPRPKPQAEKSVDPQDDPLLRELSRAGGGADQAQQEMQQLFRRVETRLREIDDLLNDASAGNTAALDGVGEAGIDELLQRTRQNGQSVVEDIDRILEIAAQNGGT